MKEGLSRLFWIILSVGALSYFIGDIVVAYQRLIVRTSIRSLIHLTFYLLFS